SLALSSVFLLSLALRSTSFPYTTLFRSLGGVRIPAFGSIGCLRRPRIRGCRSYNASKFIYWFFVFSSIISGFLGAWAFMRRREEAFLAAFFGQCKDTAQAVHRWLGKCWSARSQLHQWSHDEEGDNNVEYGGQTKGEGKALNFTDSQHVDHNGTN